jgi:hypothetical protein
MGPWETWTSNRISNDHIEPRLSTGVLDERTAFKVLALHKLRTVTNLQHGIRCLHGGPSWCFGILLDVVYVVDLIYTTPWDDDSCREPTCGVPGHRYDYGIDILGSRGKGTTLFKLHDETDGAFYRCAVAMEFDGGYRVERPGAAGLEENLDLNIFRVGGEGWWQSERYRFARRPRCRCFFIESEDWRVGRLPGVYVCKSSKYAFAYFLTQSQARAPDRCAEVDAGQQSSHVLDGSQYLHFGNTFSQSLTLKFEHLRDVGTDLWLDEAFSKRSREKATCFLGFAFTSHQEQFVC